MPSELTRQEVRRACELTSVRAIPRVLRTDDNGIRFLWILAIVTCAVLTMYQLSNVLMSYCSFSANVNIQQLQSNPHFPDVTACRVNPYHYAWHNQWTFEQYLRSIEQLEKSDILVDWLSTMTDEKRLAMLYLKSPSGYYSNLHLSDDELYVANSSFVMSCFYFLWSTPADMESMINCSATISLSFLPEFGKCVTFHLCEDQVQNVRGLVAILYLEDLFNTVLKFLENSSIFTGDGTGMKVIIHAPGTYPDVGLSVNVPPGTETAVNVNEIIRIRLPYPYGICVHCPFLTPGCYPDDGALLYTLDGCNGLCYQRDVIDQCACVDNAEVFTEVELRLANFTMCGNLYFHEDTRKEYSNIYCNDDAGSRNDITEGLSGLLCLQKVRANLSNLVCNCPVPCNEYQYESSVSYTTWPHKSYELAFYKYAIRDHPVYGSIFGYAYEPILTASESGLSNDSETLRQLAAVNLIENNFIRLKVHFGRRGVHQLKDSAAMTWDALMSNVGGTLSLWVDVTAVTVVELIELVYNILKARRNTADRRAAPEVQEM